jgi:hypothetical protein
LFSDQMSRSRRLNLCSFGAERSDCRIPVFFADGQYVEGIKSVLIEIRGGAHKFKKNSIRTLLKSREQLPFNNGYTTHCCS